MRRMFFYPVDPVVDFAVNLLLTFLESFLSPLCLSDPGFSNLGLSDRGLARSGESNSGLSSIAILLSPIL